MDALELTVISETAKVITLGWEPPVNCIGYVFYVNDKRVSNTWNPTVKQVPFGKSSPDNVYKVVAVSAEATGSYPNTEVYGANEYGKGVYVGVA